MADADYLTVGRLDRSEIARLLSRIVIDRDTRCWNWQPEPRRKYGRVNFNGREESAHRVIYAWLVEPLPRGLGADIPQLDHLVCDNTRCCNPAHLMLGTARANTLRSNNAAAQNARKTHCKNGHPLPHERNKWDGGRECAICKKATHQSENFVQWNREFGRQRFRERYHGPDAEAFKSKRRDNLRAWAAKNRDYVNAKQREYMRARRAKQRGEH